MNASKIKASIIDITGIYKAKLSSYKDSVFETTPPINGWSYSEVYSHIFDLSLLSLIASENCVNGKGEDKPTQLIPKLILFFGALPPAKYKVPKGLIGRVKKINKRQALEAIHKFEKGLDEAYPSIENSNKSKKTKHPRLGYLNARQWLRFIEIHLKHHLKQLGRIEKSFQQSI